MQVKTKFSPYSYRDDPLVPEFSDDKPIIVFDGYCALCSGWAKFVLRHDKKQRFRLLPAQTPLGQAIYKHYGLYTTDFESNILIDQGQAWLKSEGSILMAQGLGFPWSAVIVLKLIPTSLLDVIYTWVARNRFKWFGRLETCYVPKDEYKSRFLGHEQVEPYIFQTILGSTWESLPQTIKKLHSVNNSLHASGLATVDRGTNWLALIVAKVFRFPASGQNIPIKVGIERSSNSEKWTRTFGTRSFTSHLSLGKDLWDRLIVERFGPFSFGLALLQDNGKLRFVTKYWSFWKLPLPIFLLPSGDSYEYEKNGRFNFHVEIGLPFIGLVVRYSGWLTVND